LQVKGSSGHSGDESSAATNEIRRVRERTRMGRIKNKKRVIPEKVRVIDFVGGVV